MFLAGATLATRGVPTQRLLTPGSRTQRRLTPGSRTQRRFRSPASPLPIGAGRTSAPVCPGQVPSASLWLASWGVGEPRPPRRWWAVTVSWPGSCACSTTPWRVTGVWCYAPVRRESERPGWGESSPPRLPPGGVRGGGARAPARDGSPPYGLWRLVLDESAIRGDAGGGPQPDLWPQVSGDPDRPAPDEGADSGSARRFALFAE